MRSPIRTQTLFPAPTPKKPTREAHDLAQVVVVLRQAQDDNDWAQDDNDWAQDDNDWAQDDNDWAQDDNDWAQDDNDWAEDDNDCGSG